MGGKWGRTKWWRHALLTLVCACVSVCVCLNTARAGTREAYVWQRAFDEEVTDAVRELAPQLDAVCVLAAEVSWKNGRLDVVRVPVELGALAALKKPVGLALRIGDYAGAFSSDDAAARALAGLARDLLRQARAAGLTVAELQIDYDCAESKLAGYRLWLQALRTVATEARTRLIITSLPVWLRHVDFAALVKTADGFVLQVHSLERPKSPDGAFALCDPVRALAWAKQASALGVPFRVALPTYGYVLAFDRAGKYLGLEAEGPRPSWPADAQRRVVRTDAAAMARLAREIESAALQHCSGVIWFRLPVPRDRYNWDATTFATVLRGDIPSARITVEVDWSQSGLAEIVVVNRGQTTEPLPTTIALKWPSDVRLLAADGIGGFRLEVLGGQAQGIIRAADVTADASVAPGRKARIAWLRYAHEISLEVSLPAAP